MDALNLGEAIGVGRGKPRIDGINALYGADILYLPA
jgi:hypothetical protein